MADGRTQTRVRRRLEAGESPGHLDIEVVVEVLHPEDLHSLTATRVERVERDTIAEIVECRR